MSRRSATAVAVCVLIWTLQVGVAGADGRVELETADLASALAADGSFIGNRDTSGTIDTSAWRLVSNLAAGEPPRFAPASALSAASDGNWSALGSDVVGTDGALNDAVRSLAADEGGVHVGGAFTYSPGVVFTDRIARWSSNTWSGLGSPGDLTETVYALAVMGNDLYVGGAFTDAAGIDTADYVARWNSASGWRALGANLGGTDGALNNTVFALAVAGDDLYVGGAFTSEPEVNLTEHVARWSDDSWWQLGSSGSGALNGTVYALAVVSDDVYIGGSFTDATGIDNADYLVRWNISTDSWSALGANVAGTNGALNNDVYALATAGSDLYIGGAFTSEPGVTFTDHVARWSDGDWWAVGSPGDLNGSVYALAVAGIDLYVGGGFTNADGIVAADYVAHWNSADGWSALGANVGGADGALNDAVYALGADEGGIYVGGQFTNVAGIPQADYVARFVPDLLPCLSAPFSDVPVDHPFCAEINWMKNSAISTGFDDGTYRPSIPVTRQAMSAFMARLAGATLTDCTDEPFRDVSIGHPFCPEIKWMKDNEISTGFSDGTYRPSIEVTRQAMSAFMARLAGAAPTECHVAPFTDVPTDHPFCPEITWMKDNEISTGFSDDTYRPSIEVTRQAMSAFMYRVSSLIP